MPGSPFDLDEGFENIPVVQAPAQAINKVANTGTKYTKQQAAAMTKSFVKQLYGSTSGSATDDDDDQQQDTNVNAAAKAQRVKTNTSAVPKNLAAAHIQQTVIPQKASSAKTPEEEAQIAEARRQLYQHSSEYYDATFGNMADVESEVMKEAQKRQQREQERQQEEEQEKEEKKMAELEEKKKDEAIAVTRARNKAEANRGASG